LRSAESRAFLQLLVGFEDVDPGSYTVNIIFSNTESLFGLGILTLESIYYS
jgi:hypothetical protein